MSGPTDRQMDEMHAEMMAQPCPLCDLPIGEHETDIDEDGATVTSCPVVCERCECDNCECDEIDGDPHGNGNGACDECGGVVEYDDPTEPRKCVAHPEHDPYSDGMGNGGDPLPGDPDVEPCSDCGQPRRWVEEEGQPIQGWTHETPNPSCFLYAMQETSRSW